MPQRSVTRFFIPMIDVLTLLFCIYLLLPMVGTPGDGESEAERRTREERLRNLEAELAGKTGVGEALPANVREELEKLRQAKIKALESRLSVRVLEIDPGNGKLFFRDPDRVEISSEADAQKLIDRDREQARDRELFYLALYPRDKKSGYPTVEQEERYTRWFKGKAALRFDVPGSGPGKER